MCMYDVYLEELPQGRIYTWGQFGLQPRGQKN